MDMKKVYRKKEFRLGVRAISLPLILEDVFEYSGLVEMKEGNLRYKPLSPEEEEWAKYLQKEAIAYIDWCDKGLG